MATAARAGGPKTRTPCKVGRTAQQGATNYFNNSDTADSAITLRLQRLMGLGAHGHSANLLAALVWGEAA